MSEIWKSVPGYEGHLEVSDHGRVRSLPMLRQAKNGIPQKRAGCLYKPYVAQNGYFHIQPQVAGRRKKKLLVHRLVALAFVPGHFEDATVNHRDGDRLNNHVDNLEWLTRAENTSDIWKSGRIDFRGDKHPSTKLSDANVIAIPGLRASGMRVADIAKHFGVSMALIYKILEGRKRTATLHRAAPAA